MPKKGSLAPRGDMIVRLCVLWALASPAEASWHVDPYDPPSVVNLRRLVTSTGSSCPGGAATVTAHMDEALYDHMADAVVAVYTDHTDMCMAGNCPRAEFMGCVVRFPGNDVISYTTEDDTHFGGADGCWENSRGLFSCSRGQVLSLLDAYRGVCSKVSLGDFAVIAAEALMAFTATSPGEASAAFKKNFMFGRRCTSLAHAHRVTLPSAPLLSTPNPPLPTQPIQSPHPPLCSTREECEKASPKKLPNAATGCDGLSKLFIGHIYSGYDYPMTSIRSSICSGTNCKPATFAHGKEGDHEYNNMSKAWYLTAAIAGMRTLENAQSPNSVEGSSPVDSGYLKTMLSDGPRFDNGYFKAMVNAGVSERPCRLLCEGSPFPWEKKCSWGLTCSGCSQCDESTALAAALALSRSTDASDCDAAKFLQPHALAVQQFAKDESAWLQAFMEAWWIGTTNAQGGLHFLMPPTSVPVKALKCPRLRKKDRCAHLGCAWNGTLCTAAWSKCPLGSAPVRLLHLLRARLVASRCSARPGWAPDTGTPATASGARASRLHSRRFSCLLTV